MPLGKTLYLRHGSRGASVFICHAGHENSVTHWAKALQSCDFTVQHEARNLNVMPDSLSRLFQFEAKEATLAPVLAPIFRHVPSNPALQVNPPHRPYHLSTDKLDNIKPVRSDRELFGVSPSFVSSTQFVHSGRPGKTTTSANPRVWAVLEVSRGYKKSTSRTRDDTIYFVRRRTT